MVESSVNKQGKFERRWILNHDDLKNCTCNFIRDFSSGTDRDMAIEDFQMFLNNDLLPNTELELKLIQQPSQAA